MRRALCLLLLLGATACNSITPHEYVDLGRRAGFRCVAIERDVTVISPFDPGTTQDLVDQVRAALDPIVAAFEIEPPKDLVVRFVVIESAPIEVTDDGQGGFDVSGVPRRSVGGVRAFAYNTPDSAYVQLFVMPKGTLVEADGTRRIITLSYDLEPILRHELTHVCAKIAGLDGSTWFDEGIAEEFESRQPDSDGRLLPLAFGTSLAEARDGHEAHSMVELIEWDEDLHGILQGEEKPFALGRPLGHSLVRYLLDVTPGEDLVAKLRAIVTLTPDELLAHEPHWRAWLEALPAN